MILITNDDGINAEGIAALKGGLEGLDDLFVCAPADDQSGVSHGFSLRGPIRVEKIIHDGQLFGHGVAGTPVDAVKLALRALMPTAPVLVVSGINRGENSGVDLLYSGTVAGAMEAAVIGTPAIAFSLARVGDYEMHYSFAAGFARRICEAVLQRGLPAGAMLNVNIPSLPASAIKGVRITHQADSNYLETLDRRLEEGRETYYWTKWNKTIIGDGAGSDVEAVREGCISITPIHARYTNHALLNDLHNWDITL